MTEPAQKSSLAKAATIFAMVLLVSVGLCGINFVAVIAFQENARSGLMVTAYLEVAGMIVGAAGLLVVALLGIVRAIFFRGSPPVSGESDES